MRTFKMGGVDDRRFVVIERDGSQVKVIKGNADGSTRQSIKSFADEAEARAAGEQMARELESRGYRERNSKEPGRAASPAAATAKTAKAVAVPARPSPADPRDDPDGLDLDLLAEADDGPSSEAEALLPRIAPPPGADPGARPKAKAAKKKKKKKKTGAAPGQGGDLDRRMIALFCAAGLACLGAVAFLGYKAFLAPASIVGNWTGGRTEHEIGKYLTHVDYHLILDANRRASMAVGEGPPSVGTYTYETGRLRLAFKDEEGEERAVEYRTKLGGGTLDLYDVGSGQKVVQLIRSFENKAVGDAGGKSGVGPAQPAPADLAAAPADKAADEKLASVAFAAKDTAFALRHPPGWEAETGARGDNTYSWVRLTKGSTRIRVFADVAGSLLAGPNSGDEGPGSELAPVHSAHLRYKKDAEELYSKYEESPPATFPASGLGEGRIATFTATGDGLFGAKLKGIRVTFLINDRRVAILCEAPAASFDKTLPTFLAVCRSLSR